MAQTPISLLLLRRLTLASHNPKPPLTLLLSHPISLKPYSTTSTTASSPEPPKPSTLSARMSFIFDQIDAIERDRSEKHETLERIRAWRQSKDSPPQPIQNPQTMSTQSPEAISSQNGELESEIDGDGDSVANFSESTVGELKKMNEVEVVHPWPEWIELMERLVQQNYFDHRRRNEDKMIKDLGFDVTGIPDGGYNGVGVDFTKDFKTVQTACLNFGKDRFDILRSLPRQDIQLLVGYGCPTSDRKVVFSAKLLRKHVHLDEGDVCSNCNLRSSCDRSFLLTNKEDEARTVDIMRVLLTYGFDPINGSVVNKSLLKQKSVKTVVRKLLHQVVKLSAVPIDPNLPPPIIKKPPPKVKQPPPPPKKRVGRDDIEMKKGDWLCPKCDFMNFAKNTVCLQCDAKRPKRQLLPGEWECPECNFLNYRRNMVCFHCECKRPHDEFTENKTEERKTRLEKIANRQEISNAWNLDFDDDESDGADVAAFEYADSAAMNRHSPLDSQAQEGNFGGHDDDLNRGRRFPGVNNLEYSEPGRHKMGFNDFDDEDDIGSYELDTQNNNPSRSASRKNFSGGISESEDIDGSDDNFDTDLRRRSSSKSMHKNARSSSKSMHKNAAFSEDDELDIDSDEDLSVHPKWKSSHVADNGYKNRRRGLTGSSMGLSFGSDQELALDSDVDEDFGSGQTKQNKQGSGRRNFQRSSDLEDLSFSGSESDNNDLRSRRNSSRGNKTAYGKKGNNFRDRDNYDFVRDTWGSSKGKMGGRRDTWNDDFDRSSRGPWRRENDRGGSKGKMGGRRDSWDDDFGRSSHGSWSRGNDRGGWKTNKRDSVGRNFKGPKREGFHGQRQGKPHYVDMDRDIGEFRNSRRVIER